jgi:glycine dehydrogenase subunit 1
MSNICSNENLCALAAVVYLTGLGKIGMVRIGELCASKATFAKEQILQIDGVEEVEKNIPFFNEFVISLPMDASEFVGKMINKGYAAGFPLGKYYKDRPNQLLIAVTEKRTKEEIKGLANSMEAILK